MLPFLVRHPLATFGCSPGIQHSVCYLYQHPPQYIKDIILVKVDTDRRVVENQKIVEIVNRICTFSSVMSDPSLIGIGMMPHITLKVPET